MSNFYDWFTEKTTGELCRVHCIDDYFGRHRYGYLPEGEDTHLNEEQFNQRFEKEKTHEPA